MNNLNTFYKIGAIGILLTAALHVLLAMVVSNGNVHTGFAMIYPSWIAFFLLGFAQMEKKEEEEVR